MVLGSHRVSRVLNFCVAVFFGSAREVLPSSLMSRFIDVFLFFAMCGFSH